MTYATLLWTAHWLGLAALTAGTVSMLHNIAVHYRARAWSAQAQREFLGASLSQLLGIMAMAYAAGGFFVRGVMSTNQLPLGHHLAAVVTLFTFATSAAIVLQVIVRPQLRDMQGAALSVSLSPNDVLAASLCLAGLSAALVLYFTMLLAPDIVPHPGHLALLTLVIWTLLALPALAGLLFNPLRRHLRALAEEEAQKEAFGALPQFATMAAGEGTSSRHVMPRFEELQVEAPQPGLAARVAHIPARPAPRPVLVPRAELSAA